MSLPIVRLQPQRHKRALGGHPWIYSNELVMDPETKAIEPGSIVEFRAHDKRFIGNGSFNPHCLIAGRIFSWQMTDQINGDWIFARLKDALTLRDKIIPDPFYRLVHAEADRLPGLIIDRFGDHLSVQVNTAGMEKLEAYLIDALKKLLKPETITLRNDSAARLMEGLKRETKIVHGKLKGPIEIRENGLTYFADLESGQKTGWYFDQRDNHALVARYSSKANSLLDLYCHAGGFGIVAANAGVKKVTCVDASEAALILAQQAADENNLSKKVTFQRSDVFEDLEKRITAKEKFDVVVADPPAFAKTRKDVGSGARGYRKLARLSASVTAPHGLLFIASCSYNMELPNFIEQVAIGITEAHRQGRILHTTFAAPDHPMHPHLPESSYLKALLVKLD